MRFGELLYESCWVKRVERKTISFPKLSASEVVLNGKLIIQFKNRKFSPRRMKKVRRRIFCVFYLYFHLKNVSKKPVRKLYTFIFNFAITTALKLTSNLITAIVLTPVINKQSLFTATL